MLFHSVSGKDGLKPPMDQPGRSYRPCLMGSLANDLACRPKGLEAAGGRGTVGEKRVKPN